MIKVIARALATVEPNWTYRPNHELYVQLFELSVLAAKNIRNSRLVLEHLGTLLLSIEIRIRDETTSESVGKIGREQQNRCLQSAVECIKASSSPDHSIMQYVRVMS